MRLYYGTYGHHLSGKLYVYWGDDNLRTGEQVVAPVTNKKSGKTYDTMFTIARAQNEKNAQGEVDRLTDRGIFIKTIGGRGTLSLPGGTMFDSKAGWKRDSDRRYENRKRARLGLSPLPSITQKEQTKTRKLFTLPGISPPVVRPTSQRKKPTAQKKKSPPSKATSVLKALAKQNYEVKDTATEKAKSALLSQKDTAADSFKQKERVMKLRQREAFKE